MSHQKAQAVLAMVSRACYFAEQIIAQVSQGVLSLELVVRQERGEASDVICSRHVQVRSQAHTRC